MSKGARDMVTDADFAVEKLIKERLLTAFPHDAYLGEETGHVKGGEHFRNLGRRPDR
jgi:fructose-1,6-bisphosphatase/inositol monophosphatase family enzyme